uniref:Fibrinogen-related protein 2.19 n=1 Tax=Biomphalaria glabrata TaxID=6526 RepID=D9J088_BIOGL|nr:fibrinogen-related protein 2.19 [Biomphalaria glabrata]
MASLPLRLVLLVSMATLIRSSSWLNFTGNSETIRELIQPLKLTCTFQISKNDSENDSQVLFMSIYHETKRVIASISKYQPVATSLYPSVTKVQGQIYHSNESKDSYLQVTWTHPKLSESGKYFCLAHAWNSTSQNSVFDADITVNVIKSSTDDLAVALSYIQDRLDKDGVDSIQISRACPTLPESCRDVISSEDRVVVTLASGLKVMCDTKTDGGGWIIFQRRINGYVDFYRGWKEYRDGFGDYDIGEFYLGNENIFKLTSSKKYDLRIDLEFNNTKYFAFYTRFEILGEQDYYKLQIGGYSGNAGDALTNIHNDKFFSTYDKDNDLGTSGSCAVTHKGAWWYRDCYDSNLNGKWGSDRINWSKLTGITKSVTFTEMKIREIELN